MNKIIAILFFLFAILSVSIAQCDTLKKENESLKKSLNINKAIVESTQNDIEFRITQIQGDIKTQHITISVLSTNKSYNRTVFLKVSESDFITIDGEKVKYSDAYNNLFLMFQESPLATDVPVKSTCKIGPVLPSMQFLKMISLKYSIIDPNKGIIDGRAEFRDLKINWK